MELMLKTKRQHQIADMLWAAENDFDVNRIMSAYGHDARVVHDMMVAAYLDNVVDVDLAQQVLKAF